LKINDHVVKINDLDVEKITKEEYCNLGDLYKNDELKITVKRDGKLFEFTLKRYEAEYFLK
jgi:C-terminal processing protease CtpA/Prc